MDKRSNNPWDYLDFELEIRRGARGEYVAQVLRSPEAGEPEEEVAFSLAGEELAARLEELEDALYIASETRGGNTATDETRTAPDLPPDQTVREFGAELFRGLFAGDIQTAYRFSLQNAMNQKKGLRLKLRVHPSSGLTQVPWEFLYDPSSTQYLGLSARRPLVRYLSLPRPTRPLHAEPPLRILGMVASPSGLRALDVAREKRLVEEATEELRESGKVEIVWIEGETWHDLHRAILRGSWHVFHFVGHGTFDPGKQEGALVFADEEGEPHPFPADKLADILTENDDLRLVFLNSCEGARGSETDALSSASATLVSKGIAAAVAMQYEITDDAAIEFSRRFYEFVADGLPVDAAVAAARTSLSNKVSDTLEWGTPVLYTNAPDGRIFDLREDPAGRYREAVASVWTGDRLQERDADWLRDLASNSLNLAHDTAATIEREVMGDTVEAILERQKRDSFWPRLLGWARQNVLLAAAGSLLVAAILGYFVYRQVDPVLESRAIEDLFVSHYEQVGTEKYAAAFSDFSEAEQDRRGSAEEYAQDNKTWCTDVGSEVREPQIDDIEGSEATGTVSVVYHTTCGGLQRQVFDTETTYTWGLVKEDGGEWKLDSREEERVEYTRVPGEVGNGGTTLSSFGGPEKGNLDSVRASHTATSAQDACDETFNYPPANVVDGDPETGWHVGGTGVDEWVELTYEEPIKVNRVGIIPGYAKVDRCDDTDRFYQYYVIREAKIQFTDGSEVTAEFEKEPEMQFVDTNGHVTKSLRITILDVYPPGDKPGGSSFDYEDSGTLGKAAISEVKVEQD
jgi:CHAT domain-containing protein